MTTINAYTIRREKKIESRNKINLSFKLWNEDDEEPESIDEMTKKFIKIKNYFSTDKLNINDYEYSDSESENNIITPIMKETDKEAETIIDGDKSDTSSNFIKPEFINRKTRRVYEQEIFEEPLPSLPESVGPQPMHIEFDRKDERKFYAGTGIKQKEADLFSHYVQQGKRIPRRGEVGLSSDEINRYESLGYVMSGTRHKTMNLARMKKEQLLYTAEEKRALAIYNLEEQQRRERNIINEMKYMWQTKKEDVDEDEQEQQQEKEQENNGSNSNNKQSEK